MKPYLEQVYQEREQLQNSIADIDELLYRIEKFGYDEFVKTQIAMHDVVLSDIFIPGKFGNQYYMEIGILIEWLRENKISQKFVEWNGGIHWKNSLIKGNFDYLPFTLNEVLEYYGIPKESL